MPSTRILSLDILRLISVAFVWLGHGLFADVPVVRHAKDLGLAPLGVTVFFVLSGYLITDLLLKRKREGKPLWEFFIRRLARLMPAYWVYLLAVYLLNPTASLWPALFYVQNVWGFASPYTSHLWSLSVEEQFYLLWPLALWLFHKMPAAALVILSAASMLLVGMGSGYFGTGANFVSLLAGSAVAIVGIGNLATSKRSILLVTLGGGLVALAFYTDSNSEGFTAILCRTFVALGLMLAALWYGERFTSRINPRVASAISTAGVMTYGLYLYHAAVFHLVKMHAPAYPDAWRILGTIAIASLSYFAFERPIMRTVSSRLKLCRTIHRPQPQRLRYGHPTRSNLRQSSHY